MRCEPVRNSMMTFDSAHSGPGRKLVTLTERKPICKRATGENTSTDAPVMKLLFVEVSGVFLEPAKGLEPPTY